MNKQADPFRPLKPNHITMRAVAERARVHHSTVSRALRDDASLPERTRRRVQAVAARMGYTVNPLVSALMQEQRGTRRLHSGVTTLAYLDSFPAIWQYPNFRRTFEGAKQQAECLGYKVERFRVGEDGLSLRRFCSVATSRGIHGLLVGPLSVPAGTLNLDWSLFSSVAIGFTLKEDGVPHVAHDHYSSMMLALDQCLARNYRRIGLALSRSNDARLEHKWRAAYLVRQSEWNQADRIPPLVSAEWSREVLLRWYHEFRPDAVVGIETNSTLDWLRAGGVAVPRETAFVSLECDTPHGEVTGIYQNPEHHGAAAVRVLVGMVEANRKGRLECGESTLVTGTWVEGATLRRWLRATHERLPAVVAS